MEPTEATTRRGAPAPFERNRREPSRASCTGGGDLGAAFLKIPTTLQGPEDADTVFVVHEVRSSWVGVRRRVIGVFKTRAEAERKAAETRLSLEGFIERHGGARCGDEKCGGSLLRYWIAGAPQVILGLAVEVEEANFRR